MSYPGPTLAPSPTPSPQGHKYSGRGDAGLVPPQFPSRHREDYTIIINNFSNYILLYLTLFILCRVVVGGGSRGGIITNKENWKH